jgi:hypothetical protein
VDLFEDHMFKTACSDPRDRLYSRLAFAQSSIRLTPDDSKTTVGIFVDMVDRYVD